MFVKWQRRLRDGEWRLSASLVESRRIDGEPRQHTIAYLGTIADGDTHHTGARDLFWHGGSEPSRGRWIDGVESRLRSIAGDLTDAERQQIEAKIQERVPKPTPAEIAEYRRRVHELAERLAEIGS